MVNEATAPLRCGMWHVEEEEEEEEEEDADEDEDGEKEEQMKNHKKASLLGSLAFFEMSS